MEINGIPFLTQDEENLQSETKSDEEVESVDLGGLEFPSHDSNFDSHGGR